MRAFFFSTGIVRLLKDAAQRNPTMPFYLTLEQDDFDKIPELQVCIAEALYDAEAVLSNPAAFKPEEITALRDQITAKLERAWEITGGRRTCVVFAPAPFSASLVHGQSPSMPPWLF